ncbi:preprotein translocase subunit YajC [Azospirillum picis]|uniref:Sec translocon accessory complex subunit YajC n=1 Tax=Azospirillum picis TaxID=488438 RepID=A0ABU0MGG4_9PROT|nr:preprotein translocase subunit YajC [Azospirillum picis]MBP2298493.1 preprotein translocase subunit YajC [Azospirillum picis]MDQ0532458.1 preprotein translocase subunit YajC [Azospirillum picis]
MFVSTAYAQTAAPAGGGGDMLVQFLPLVLIFVVFYFLLIRPQQKKMKEHKTMLSAIRRGDRVVTGGGIIGIVTKVGADDEITVEIAENVRVRCLRSTVNLVLAKTEPAGTGKGGDGTPAATADGQAKPAETTAAGGIGKLFGRK